MLCGVPPPQINQHNRILYRQLKSKDKFILKLNNDIDKLVRNLEVKIEDEKDKIVKKFSDEIFYKLESIVINKNESFDNSARLAINNTASLFFHNYKKYLRF